MKNLEMKLYILENKNDIHIILDDNGVSIVSQRKIDKSELYDLFMIKSYETCKILFQNYKKNPEELLNINMDNFLDFFSICKNEHNRIVGNVNDEMQELLQSKLDEENNDW